MAVLIKLLAFCNCHRSAQLKFADGFPEDKRGNGNIRKNIKKYLSMAQNNVRVLVLTDLDSAPCAPELVRDWCGISSNELPARMRFRIASKEVESWIIADRARLGRYLGVSEALFTREPDAMHDPKEHLLSVIKTHAKRKWCKAMLPTKDRKIGPDYNFHLCHFISNHWDIATAKSVSPSLGRAIRSLISW